MKNTLTKTLSSSFWHFIRKQWVLLPFVQFFCFAWSIDHTFLPYVLMLFIDILTNFMGDRNGIWAALATPIWLGATIWIIVEIGFRLSGILSARAFPKLEGQIRLEMFDYVQ